MQASKYSNKSVLLEWVGLRKYNVSLKKITLP